MTLADISIKNPVFAWMLMAGLIIFGIIGYSRMGVSQLPNVDFPVVSVNLTWQGAAPEVIETDVIDIIEDSIMGIQGINDVSSSMQQGSASITIEFELNKDIDVAVQEVQNKIAQVQKLLPTDIDPPTVSKSNPEDQPIVWLSVTGNVPFRDLTGYVQDHIKDQFSTIDGVGEVILGGYVDKNLRVWVDQKKLEKYQVTVEDVITAIQEQHKEVPAGRLETPKKEFNVRVLGEAMTPKDFGNIIIQHRSGNPIYKTIYLKNVATIEDGLNDIRRISRRQGVQAIGIGIRKQRGSNEVAVAKNVLARMEQIKKQLPKGMDINVSFNATKFIKDSIHELVFTLILSALITSLVCWIFLGSWSATVNILLAIPTSILGTFIVINFLGFTLNTFTVLGLSLAVGIVVDDAIMVLENIVRYREHGLEKVAAAQTGARQITFAALAATIALIAIFLPVAFMSGVTGKFFFQYGVTISIAVALSLLEALTLTPMRCSQFLHIGERKTWFGKSVENSFKYLANIYKKMLSWVLTHRWIVLISSLIFFLGSLCFLKLLQKEFVPAQDQSMFLCRIQTPVDSSLEFTNEKMKLIEKFIMNRPEVNYYFGNIGGSNGMVNTGGLFITLKPFKDRPIASPFTHRPTQKDLMNLFRKKLGKIPKIKVVIQDLSLAGFTAKRGFPVEFIVRGPNWDTLTKSSMDLKNALAKNNLFTDVDTDYLDKVNEVCIIPDRNKSNARGVSVASIGDTINALIGGEIVNKYTEDGHRYDVRVRLLTPQRQTENDIDRLQVWNNRGELVDLKDVVSVTRNLSPLTITRRNRERAISIFANVAQGKSQTDALTEVQRLSNKMLPAGYTIVFTGSAKTFNESFSSLIFVLLLGILIAYMVLASQFNSYMHPVTVLLALPFSVSGAFIALWLTKQSLNIYSFIGLILLMGIVKKNSILLVDFTNQYRKQGFKINEALTEACPIRLRPILMTSIATITAAIPPALALGPGAETRVPMSVSVIGGVIFSTILTLFVVPAAYSLFVREDKNTSSQSKPE